MELTVKLPDNLIKAISDEVNASEIVYSSYYDIKLNGEYTNDGYLLVSSEYVYVTLGDEIIRKIEISDIDTINCETNIGCGVLVVKRKSKNEEELVIRFSMRHLTRISYITRGVINIRDNVTKKLIVHGREKTCPVCGKPMRGRSVCSYCNKEKSNKIFISFLKVCFSYKVRMALIALCMILIAAVALIRPKIQQVFIDDYLAVGKGGVAAITVFAIVTLIFTLINIILDMAKYWLCNVVGTSISKNYREMIYHKIQKLSMAFINDRKTGAIMNRCTRDTNEISRFMQDAFSGMISAIFTMVAVIIVMFTISWKLTLISIIFMPISMGTSLLFHKNVHRRYHNQWVHSDRINSGLQDVLSGIRVVKSFGTEEMESKKFERLCTDFGTIQSSNEVFFAVFYPIMTFILGMGMYFVTYMGGSGVLNGDLSIGQISQLLSYAGILYGPLEWMTFLPRRITQLMTSLERIYDVLDEEPLIQDSTVAVDKDIEGHVQFKNVRFGYYSYAPVIDGISLDVKPGEMIGLVGASGTGKSTIINLLMRLYDVDDGEILIDGVNITDYKMEKFHSQLGIVLQENFLFAGTIFNNLRYAKPDATDEEIIQAAKIANAHDFIMKTPDGYNTYVGEHGYNLSGGERQRLAIARAVLNNPRILILDEATSNLDTESEYLIQKALERLKKGCTTFAIAHRLSTLKDADRLVVIDDKKIAEVGSHRELMEKKGIYYKLVSAQLEMQKL